MRILHIMSSMEGGAARGAYALHKGLKKHGIESKILTYQSSSTDKDIMTIPPATKRGLFRMVTLRLERFPFRFYPNRKKIIFSTGLAGFDFTKTFAYRWADIIHLHWINNNFVNIKHLNKVSKPIVWTMRDMWSMTGGCHYSMGCINYEMGCGRCPQLNSDSAYDLSRLVLHRKKKFLPSSIKLVGLSNWLSEKAKKSDLFKKFDIRTIPNVIDVDEFLPINKDIARKTLDIKTNKKIILTGSTRVTDFYKGFNKFTESLKRLDKEKYFLCFFGKSDDINCYKALGFEHRNFGYLHDNLSLRLVYSASDVSVFPSIEEAWGKTLTESMSCGTPVVCFNATGPKDIVDHKLNGYKAIPYESADLANGIEWVTNHAKYDELCQNAINKISRKFDNGIVAVQYIDLYKSLI